MGFSLFTKNKTITRLEHFLKQSSIKFSKDQSYAIINALYKIANTDMEFPRSERKVLKKVARALNVDWADPLLQDEIIVFPEIEEIRNLTDEQKEWVAIVIVEMIRADGATNFYEENELDFYFEKIMKLDERIQNRVVEYLKTPDKVRK